MGVHPWSRARWLRPNAVDPTMSRELLIPVHGHPLAVPAELAVRRRRDGSRTVAAHGRALLECEQLLGAERLVVDLRRRFDQILQMSAGEEVAEVDEFAVVLIFDCRLSQHMFMRWCV